MALTLSQLCINTEKTYSLKLEAGKNGMDNTVRWVHMVEDSQVPDFLHGNELVFTTGIGNHNTEWLLNFVKSLYERSAAGVVVNIGPYIKEIPPQLIVYCEKNDFPLFSMPWETRIIDITYEFCRRIINNERNEQSAAEAFRNLIFNPEVKSGYANTLERCGFHTVNSFVVISMSFKKAGRSIINKVLNKYNTKLLKIIKKSSYPTIQFIQDSCLTVIRQNSSDEEISFIVNEIEKSFEHIQADIEFFIGISTIKKEHYSVCELYKQAVAARRVAELENANSRNYSDIGIFKLITRIENKEILEDYVEGIIGKLIKYDNENNSGLLNMLRQYLYASGSIQEVAAKTGVHRNTVNYKIKQIKEILDSELKDEQKMNFLLALHILDLLSLS